MWLALGARLSLAVSINGQDYVSLAGWARANGFHGGTFARGDDIVLASKTSRLVFNVNSAEAAINGVNVRLSYPVAEVKGAAMIAQFDLNTAVRPLLSPGAYANQGRITTICIDPGHGGKDTGNRVRSFFWHSEKTYTLALALELREQLERAGFKVFLTRSKDVYVDLAARSDLANRRGADLFISPHFNATVSGKNEVKGVETYCITPVGAASSNAEGVGGNHGAATGNRCERRSLLLAYQMQKSLVHNLPAEDRDVRRARFAVLRDAKMPAILIEGGYMTNPVESKKIFSDAYRKEMAAAIVKGVLAYQHLTETPSVAKPATTKKVDGKRHRL